MGSNRGVCSELPQDTRRGNHDDESRDMTEGEKMARQSIFLSVSLNVSLSAVSPSPRPELTDRECAAIARTTLFSYEELRCFYPKNSDRKGF